MRTKTQAKGDMISIAAAQAVVCVLSESVVTRLHTKVEYVSNEPGTLAMEAHSHLSLQTAVHMPRSQ